MSIISNKVGAIFIPVSDIRKARDWYCSILELEPTYDIISEHLCCLPLDNNGLYIVLDSKVYTEDSYSRFPMFHFNTDDIQAAYEFMKEKEVELITGIEHGHWFNIKDPDGNMLMVCQIK
ncbi:VOC family protein [Mesobacillus foraminis]|uniref:Catechol 2,3-dioxygenase-like lactoylglutathione lyase family enzyme n=1 Tax=Mesobacillus foraminis TaxID=279826 RepID=A0A4R2BHT0_9BACI|nr:VOC family protein [Mesobacillus foraminis]TCN26115.1 catechol 2,3-dioxygenase-like lactoylglutathione lyase family enzyme [Mesobacillus foraminis]